jgi:hypothetical protein
VRLGTISARFAHIINKTSDLLKLPSYLSSQIIAPVLPVYIFFQHDELVTYKAPHVSIFDLHLETRLC